MTDDTVSGIDIVEAASDELVELLAAIENNSGTPAMLRLARLLSTGGAGSHLNPRQVNRFYEQAMKEDGHIQGMCYLAHWLETGVGGIPEDPEKAYMIFEKDVSHYGCGVARFGLANYLEEGHGVAKDPARAVQLYETLICEDGFNLAKLRLAKLLDIGEQGVPRNSPRAVELLEDAILSIQKGAKLRIDALDTLGQIYAEGRSGVPQSLYRAVSLYETSIADGDSSAAMTGLALILQEGADGVSADIHRAICLYEKAIEAGNDSAMIHLANLLLRGLAVSGDPTRAVELYERAAARGNKYAMRNLADLYYKGNEGVESDLKRAMELYEEIASDGRFRNVRFNLAWLLSSQRDGLPQDPVRAAQLFEDVISEEPDTNAMFHLALLLSEGRADLKQDFARAAALYERAILEDDHGPSMLNLGILLGKDHEGLGKDLTRAVELLNGATENGCKWAIIDLAHLLADGSNGNPDDIFRAVELYERGIEEMDHMGAMIVLAVILYEGEHGVKRDVPRAVQLTERALAIGIYNDKDALAELGLCHVTAPKDDDIANNERKFAIQKHWHVIAMCNLAEMLLSGLVPKNIDRAVKLVEKALKCPIAMKELQLNFEDLLRLTKNLLCETELGQEGRNAVVRIYQSIISGSEDKEAMYLLAELLTDGSGGVPSDQRGAIELYKRAIGRGHKKSMLRLGEILWSEGGEKATHGAAAFELFVGVLSEDADITFQREAVVNMALMYPELKKRLPSCSAKPEHERVKFPM